MKKALVVGIDQYEDCPLSGCCNDADAMEKLLSRNENGALNFSVKKKKNIATKAELKELIVECFSGDAEVALFYYSGHGYIDAIGGYLATPDARNYDYGISLQEILAIVNNSRCRDKVIILDSCYSGFTGSINTKSQDIAVIGDGVTILTSCQASESSIESAGHGLFTSLLIEALSGGAADIMGHITPGGIYAYIDKALGPWQQRPTFKTNVTRFNSLREVKPQVDSTVIRKLCTYFPNINYDLPLNPSFESTNSLGQIHETVEPYAIPENVAVFSDLQKLESIGLVVPVGEQHMYFAAMRSKSCRLTAIGRQYWKLVHDQLI